MTTLLRVEELTVAFQTSSGMLFANDDVSFSHNAGEWLGIMGASGSGKTVLAKAIAGLNIGKPGIIKGKMLFQERDLLSGLDIAIRTEQRNGTTLITKNSRRWMKTYQGNFHRNARNKFAYIHQNPADALNPYFAIRRHMAEACAAGGTKPPWFESQSIELFSRLRLGEPRKVLASYPHELSGGMAQRVVIAMALAQKAAYIIADECTTSLDPRSSQSTIEALQEARTGGAAILFITHDKALATKCCDRILQMKQGQVIA
jgi:ABC-type glutathione transport system ATPase component